MTERRSALPLHVFAIFFWLLTAFAAQAQIAPKRAPSATAPAPKVCAVCIRAHMEFLASDALRGRGSGTPDELVAATYIASQLQQYGIKPAGDDGSYIQRGTIVHQVLTASPELRFLPGSDNPGQPVVWTHGKQMLALRLSQSKFRGPLRRIDADNSAPAQPEVKGAVVVILGTDESKRRESIGAALEGGAVAVLAPASGSTLKSWDERGRELPTLGATVEGGAPTELGGGSGAVLVLSPDAMASVRGFPDGTPVDFEGTLGKPETSYTWNAVGMLPGRDPTLRKSAILLTAHLDHIGIGKPVKGDSIYNGADDDASGTTAVLELARALAAGARPRRTMIFALFGSEEAGGLGSAWFELHPPVPLTDIAANLEFEMIGRPDPKYPGDTLWLSGWDRSNLGPVLAAHGARLVADRRPEEQFFTRSDNYVLAKKDVVAQTASSFGLHADYHQPSDDVAHINFVHMTTVIGSLIRPLEWLANSDFRPAWKPGQKP